MLFQEKRKLYFLADAEVEATVDRSVVLAVSAAQYAAPKTLAAVEHV